MPIASEEALIRAAGSREIWHELVGPYSAQSDSEYQEFVRTAQEEGVAFVQSYLGITFRDIQEMDPNDIKPIVLGAAKWGLTEIKRHRPAGLDVDDKDLRAELMEQFSAMARGGRWTGKKRPRSQSNLKPGVVGIGVGRQRLRGFVGD